MKPIRMLWALATQHLGSLDNAHTTTLPTFVAAEMEEVLAKLPKS
jgi:hypothetical protein